MILPGAYKISLWETNLCGCIVNRCNAIDPFCAGDELMETKKSKVHALTTLQWQKIVKEKLMIKHPVLARAD